MRSPVPDMTQSKLSSCRIILTPTYPLPNDGTDTRHRRKSSEGVYSEYKRNSENKIQEYSKFLADKKSLITILFGQCDEAT